MKVVIVGGGIGGLTAALAFLKFGHTVTVLEAAPKISEVGAGVQISPNGVKVLRALDVADAVSSNVFIPLAGEFRNGKSGRLIASFSMGKEIERRHDAPYWHLHRADLIEALRSSLLRRAPDALVTNATVVSYENTETGALVVLKDGSEIEGDLVVGADGIKSAIRNQMLGDAQPQFTGNVAWRAVVPMSELGRGIPPPTACVWYGEGKHAVTYRLRQGKLANLVAVVERDDWTEESWTQKGSRDEAMADFADWHPTIRNMIDKAPAHFRWALFDRQPLDQWSEGRVSLLGDACHPMLPFMAQGAVMAMEDAYVLEREVSQSKKVEIGLSDYFQLRRDRTAKVQATARGNMGIFHQSTALGKLKTYAPLWLVSRIAPTLLDSRTDWLYGHDITE